MQVTGPAPKVVKVKRKRAFGRRNTPRSKGEDFVPWVPADTEGPQDLEEEERQERMMGLLDRYATRKRKQQVISNDESDAAPVQTAEPNQPATDDQPVADGSSGDQAIIIPYSPELGPTGQMEPDGAGRSELNEDRSTPTALQVIPPSDQAKDQPSKSKYMRSGLPRPPWLDQVITDDYLPLRGQKPSRVEVSAPGAEEVKDILCRRESFHRGTSSADWLGNLYPHIYRVPIIARGIGLREDYMMIVPATTPKEDFLQIIDDGI